MADGSEQKTSAELEREVEAQRNRVEATIGQIQDKLSPGQMVDELLTYAKNSGGGDFVANLGKSVSTNPIPVALLGIGLVWLMAKQGTPASTETSDRDWDARLTSNGGRNHGLGEDDDDFGYATVSGQVRHLGHSQSDTGERFSEFSDDTGRKFRALTDAAGNRAGHFIDDAGQSFRGFKDAAGERIGQVQDQTGDALDAATGWASHTWRKANDSLRGAGAAVSSGSEQLRRGTLDAGSTMRREADQMSKTLLGVLHDQPLVGGALAFAVGAAVASALPHTAQEDRVFGDAADDLKRGAGEAASDAYEKAKGQVSEIYEQAADKASDLYDEVKSGAANPGATANQQA